MGRVGLVYHPAYLEHDMGVAHPESPERLRAILSRLESSGTLDQLIRIEPQTAAKEWIARVHTPSYIQQLESQVPTTGYTALDPDTSLSPGSLHAAYLAAGGAMAAVDVMMEGKVDQAFCAIRPPGHHAEAARAMGFCFFNNVAIAARYIQERYGIQRVLIVDWDVHHGNGTQYSFDDDPSVLYFSAHQYPHYPGTGAANERGNGKGEGLTINVPMSGGQGDEEYCEVFEKILVPASDFFNPGFVLISAGFDAHRDDPLASMGLTEKGFSSLTHIVARVAVRHASGRVLSCLEGGYNLHALSESVTHHVQALLDI